MLCRGDVQPAAIEDEAERAAKALLEERGARFELRMYLEDRLARDELTDLRRRLGRPACEWVCGPRSSSPSTIIAVAADVAGRVRVPAGRAARVRSSIT